MRPLAAVLGLLCLSACQRPAPPARDAVQPAPVTPEVVPAPPAPATAPAAQPAAGKAVRITAPANGEVVAPGQPVTVRATLPQGAESALVMVDDRAPLPLENPLQGLLLADLTAGPHVVRVVALDDVGVSTEPGALALVEFTCGTAPVRLSGFNPAGPVLTVAAPYETVALPESGEVPLDFRVDGCTIGEAAARVRWQVDDGEAEWLAEYPSAEPLSLGRLEPGKHTLKVWLSGHDGKPIDNGGMARVERTFTVPSAGGAG